MEKLLTLITKTTMISCKKTKFSCDALQNSLKDSNASPKVKTLEEKKVGYVL
jgi:hypothetical protein